MAVYYLSNTDSDLSGGADFSKQLKTATESSNTIAISIAKSATETSYAFTNANDPNNADWETGGITVEVYFTVANSDVYLSVRADRVNSSGALQESSTATAEQNITATGLYTFNIASKDWTAGAIGDRIRIAYIFRNNKTTSTRSVTIQTGTTDTEVTTSISKTVTIASDTCDATSSVSGTTIDRQPTFAGLSEAYSTVSGLTIDVQSALASTINAISYLEGELTITTGSDITIDGVIGVVLNVDGLLDVGQNFIGIIESQGEAIGILDIQTAFSAIVNATSIAFGTIYNILGLVGTTDGSSNIEVNLDIGTGLAGIIDSISSIDGVLSLEGAGEDIEMDGSIVAISSAETAISFEDMLEIWRNDNGGTYELLVFVPFNDPYFDDYDLEVGHIYCYKARKIVDQIPHDWSNFDCITYTLTDKYIVGSVLTTSLVEGSLSVDIKLETVINNYTYSYSNLTLDNGIITVVDAVSTINGSLSLEMEINSWIAAQSFVEGLLSIDLKFVGEIIVTSTASADLSLDQSLIGIVEAISSLSSVLDTGSYFYGTISGQSSIISDLTFDFIGLQGSIAAQSSDEAIMSIDMGLEGACIIQSIISGSLIPDFGLTSLVSSTTNVSGTLGGEVSLIGIIDGQLTIVGDLTLDIVLVGEIVALTSVSGKLVGIIPLNGSIVAQSLVTVDTSIDIGLVGDISASSSVSADITYFGLLSGSVASSVLITGVMSVTIALDSQVSAVSDVTSEMAYDASFAGTISAVSNISSEKLYTDIPGKEIVELVSTITKVIEPDYVVVIILNETSTITRIVNLTSTITRAPTIISTITSIIEIGSVIPDE